MYKYKTNPTELNRNIVGIRIYDQLENGMLAPFDYIYSELFSNLLRRAEVKLQITVKYTLILVKQ